MLTQEAAADMVEEWKKLYDEHRGFLYPNRKTGKELDAYVRDKYEVHPIQTKEADNVVIENIMCNRVFKEKLPDNMQPCPITYHTDEQKVFIGIDLVSGYFCVEGSEQIYDDLFAFRGLDEKDLNNVFMVAEYVKCIKKGTEKEVKDEKL